MNILESLIKDIESIPHSYYTVKVYTTVSKDKENILQIKEFDDEKDAYLFYQRTCQNYLFQKQSIKEPFARHMFNPEIAMFKTENGETKDFRYFAPA
jgi:hypothetical protein